jgi:hypothetical protein
MTEFYRPQFVADSPSPVEGHPHIPLMAGDGSLHNIPLAPRIAEGPSDPGVVAADGVRVFPMDGSGAAEEVPDTEATVLIRRPGRPPLPLDQSTHHRFAGVENDPRSGEPSGLRSLRLLNDERRTAFRLLERARDVASATLAAGRRGLNRLLSEDSGDLPVLRQTIAVAGPAPIVEAVDEVIAAQAGQLAETHPAITQFVNPTRAIGSASVVGAARVHTGELPVLSSRPATYGGANGVAPEDAARPTGYWLDSNQNQPGHASAQSGADPEKTLVWFTPGPETAAAQSAPATEPLETPSAPNVTAPIAEAPLPVPGVDGLAVGEAIVIDGRPLTDELRMYLLVNADAEQMMSFVNDVRTLPPEREHERPGLIERINVLASSLRRTLAKIDADPDSVQRRNLEIRHSAADPALLERTGLQLGERRPGVGVVRVDDDVEPWEVEDALERAVSGLRRL